MPIIDTPETNPDLIRASYNNPENALLAAEVALMQSNDYLALFSPPSMSLYEGPIRVEEVYGTAEGQTGTEGPLER